MNSTQVRLDYSYMILTKSNFLSKKGVFDLGNYLLTISFLLIFFCNCKKSDTLQENSTSGYLITSLDSISDLIPFNNTAQVLGTSSNAVYLVDSNGTANKLLSHTRGFSFDPYHIHPVNDSIAFIIEKENEYNHEKETIVPNYSFYLLNSDHKVKLLFGASINRSINKYWFSKTNEKDCGIILMSERFQNKYYLFNQKGVIRLLPLSIAPEEEIKDVLINNDSSIWIILEKSVPEFTYEKYIHKVIWIGKNGNFRQYCDFQATNFNEYHLLNQGKILLLDARVILKLDRDSSDPSGIFLFNRDSNQVKHLFGNEEVNNLLVSNDGSYFFVSVKREKRSPEKILVIDPFGQVKFNIGTFSLTRDFFAGYGLEKDIDSDNIWISTSSGKLYYVYSKKNFLIKTILTPKGKQQLIPIGKGRALLHIREAENPLSWVLADSISIVSIPNEKVTDDLDNVFYLEDKKHYLVTNNERTTFIMDSTGKKLNKGMDFFNLYEIIKAYSIDPQNRIWITNMNGSYLLTHASKILKKYEVNNSNISLVFNAGIFATGIPGNKINIEVFDINNHLIGSGSEIVPPSGEMQIPFSLFRNTGSIWNKELKIRISFNNFNSSTAIIELNNIRFSIPFYQTKEFNTMKLFLGILFLTFLLQYLRKYNLVIYKYGTPTLWIISYLTPFYKDVLQNWMGGSVNIPLFVILLSVTLFLLFVLCYIFPAVLKRLGDLFPFDIFANTFLKIPSFRNRYFSKYLKSLGKKMIDVKSANIESKENYVSLPAIIVSNEKKGSSDIPAKEITSFLFKQKRGCKIAIIAPGGQGKSAMLREILVQYLKEFSNHNNLPIPVYIHGEENNLENIELLLRSSLGDYWQQGSDETQKKLLHKGAYLFIIDDFSEASGADIFLKQFEVGLKDYTNVSFIIALRPNEKYERTISNIQDSTVVFPLKITEELIGCFESAYLQSGEQLPAKLRNICRSNDGFYQPILVRLAILAHKAAVNNIAELYETAIRSLAGKKNLQAYKEMEANMAKLCSETYGKNGSREVHYRPEISDLINEMEKSGLLIKTDRKNVFGNPSRKFRFFHDSIQTYLAIMGFYYDNHNPEELLLQFASELHYKKDQSDFLFRSGAEIYQMALMVFESLDIDINIIINKLLHRWFSDRKMEISIRDIINSMPEGETDQLVKMAEGKSLEEVFQYCITKASNNTSLSGEFYYRLVQK